MELHVSFFQLALNPQRAIWKWKGELQVIFQMAMSPLWVFFSYGLFFSNLKGRFSLLILMGGKAMQHFLYSGPQKLVLSLNAPPVNIEQGIALKGWRWPCLWHSNLLQNTKPSCGLSQVLDLRATVPFLGFLCVQKKHGGEGAGVHACLLSHTCILSHYTRGAITSVSGCTIVCCPFF